MALFLSFLTLFLSAVSMAGGPEGYQIGRIFLKTGEQYFSSTENYGENGQTASLGNGKSYSNHELYFLGRYDATRELSYFSQISMGLAESKNGVDTRNAFNLTDIWVGADYLLYSGFVQVIPEVKASFAANPVSEATDESIVGEGSNNLQLGSYVTQSFWGVKLTEYLGARLRDGGRSHLLPWLFELHVPISHFFVKAKLDGFIPLNDDQYFDNKSKRYNVVNKVNAGSLKYYSINSSNAQASLHLGYKFTKDSILTLGYGSTLSGERSSKGSTLYASFELIFGESPARASNRKELLKILDKEKIQQGETPPPEESADQEIKSAEEVLKEEPDNTESGKFVPDTPKLEENTDEKTSKKPAPKPKVKNKFKQSR